MFGHHKPMLKDVPVRQPHGSIGVVIGNEHLNVAVGIENTAPLPERVPLPQDATFHGDTARPEDPVDDCSTAPQLCSNALLRLSPNPPAQNFFDEIRIAGVEGLGCPSVPPANALSNKST